MFVYLLMYLAVKIMVCNEEIIMAIVLQYTAEEKNICRLVSFTCSDVANILHNLEHSQVALCIQ